MPESTLASLAHALAAAPRLEAGFIALAEGMAEVDRAVVVAYLPFDARDGKLVECLTWDQGTVARTPLEVALRQFASAVVQRVQAGGTFVDVGEESDTFARMLQLPPLGESGDLALRGICFDGELAAVLPMHEPRPGLGAGGIQE